MTKATSTDYKTYQEIVDELLRPIPHDGLDLETLRRLYESKLVYLENLRIKCFLAINSETNNGFTQADYELILKAQSHTREHVRKVVLTAISANLAKRKAV